MKVIDLIKKERKPFFSIEITPPFKNKSILPIFKVIERLLPYQPEFINVTYHPQKISKIQIDNQEIDYISQKHANQVGLCSAIKYKYNVEVVPHFVCAGLNKVQVEDALFDLAFLGIDNVLALRGDAVSVNEKFKPVDGGYNHANELVSQIKAMKKSNFLNNVDSHEAVDFCIGVAGYPEKHHEAKDIFEDITNLKRKVDAGADYIVTQICYDFEIFVDWINRCRHSGIHVPIIPGLKPLTSIKQYETLKNVFHVKIPKDLEKKILSCKNKEELWHFGIEHSKELSKQLLSAGVAGIHYFTMGSGKDVEQIVKELF